MSQKSDLGRFQLDVIVGANFGLDCKETAKGEGESAPKKNIELFMVYGFPSCIKKIL